MPTYYEGPRLCLSSGVKAVFHRWVDREDLIIQFNGLMKASHIDKVLKDYKEAGILPSGVTTRTVTNTFGLVEFEDGVIMEVEPTHIKFLDTDRLIKEIEENV